MDFKQVVESGCVAVELKGSTKRAVIEELIDLLADAGKLPDRDAALRVVLEREAKMSTGMQDGVAVPHGKTPTVDGIVTALGLKREGIDFESLDGQPTRIFVMTVSSTLRTGPHIEYLAEMCRLLSRASVREQLLAAKTREEVLAILTG